MALRLLLLISLLSARLSVSAGEFSLGAIERNETVEFTLPFPASVGAGEPIVTDCECLTAMESDGSHSDESVGRRRFTYRSPSIGKVRVNVWAKVPGRPVLHSVTGYVYDRSWLISAADAQTETADVFVDTRWPQQFREVHIPRSLNLPAFALKSHAELRSRRVVLVDGGFAPVEQFALAESLRAEGFSDVVCLEGGLPSWLRSGGNFEGTAAEPVVAAATITPIEFVRSQANTPWVIVESPKQQSVNPGVRATALTAWVSALKGQRTAEGVAAYVLAVGTDVGALAQAEHAIGHARGRGPFYLAGGSAALVAFRNEQRAFAARRPEPFQTQIAAGRPLMGSGCGSCPKR